MLEGVQQVMVEKQESITILVRTAVRTGRYNKVFNDDGCKVNSVSIKEPDLEGVFLHLTGRALRN